MKTHFKLEPFPTPLQPPPHALSPGASAHIYQKLNRTRKAQNLLCVREREKGRGKAREGGGRGDSFIKHKPPFLLLNPGGSPLPPPLSLIFPPDRVMGAASSEGDFASFSPTQTRAPAGPRWVHTRTHTLAPTLAHAGAHAQVVTHTKGSGGGSSRNMLGWHFNPPTLQFICSPTPKSTPPGRPPLKKVPPRNVHTHTHKVREWTDRDIFGKCSHQRASCSAALNESVCPYPSLALSFCRGSRAGGIQSINPEPTAARFRTLKAQPAPLGPRAPSTRGAHKPDHRGGGICGLVDERQQLKPIVAEGLRATASESGSGGGRDQWAGCAVGQGGSAIWLWCRRRTPLDFGAAEERGGCSVAERGGWAEWRGKGR